MDKEIVLRTYTPVWKSEKRLYSIEGLKLPVPVSLNEVLYFTIGAMISLALGNLLSIYGNLNIVVRFVVVPVFISKFLNKQKLDGKRPHKFAYDYLIYFIMPKHYSFFKAADKPKKIVFDSRITLRNIIPIGMILKDNTDEKITQENIANENIVLRKDEVNV